jgi:hypothetical protein
VAPSLNVVAPLLCATIAEPKKLRYRLLHVAGKVSRTARISTLRIAEGWPWTGHLVQAFQRLGQLPEPVT